MSGRQRTVQVKCRVTEEEDALIEEKMKLVPARNMAACLCKDHDNVSSRKIMAILPILNNKIYNN